MTEVSVETCFTDSKVLSLSLNFIFLCVQSLIHVLQTMEAVSTFAGGIRTDTLHAAVMRAFTYTRTKEIVWVSCEKNNCPMIIVWDPYELFLHLLSSFKLFSLLRILKYKAESALEGAHSAGAIYPSFISMKRLRASLLPTLLYPESNALTIRALRHPHPEEYLGINPYTEREERVFLLKQSFFSFHSHRGSQKENKDQDGGGLALQIEGYQRSHC